MLFRFYTLYDRVYRDDTLRTAYELVTTEDKAPGVDGVRRDDIEKAPGGVTAFIAALAQDLKAGTYRLVVRVSAETNPGRVTTFAKTFRVANGVRV